MSATGGIGKGVVALLSTIAIGVVVLGFIVGIGMRLNYENTERLEALDLGVEGNKTRDELIASNNDAYSFLALGGWILAAMGIIAVVFGFLAVTGRV